MSNKSTSLEFITAAAAKVSTPSVGTSVRKLAQDAFNAAYANALEAILVYDYISHIPLRSIHLSLSVPDPQPRQPLRVIMVPAIVNNFDAHPKDITWLPRSIRHATRHGLFEMCEDLDEVAVRKNLKVEFGTLQDDKVFVMESHSPADMIRLLQEHKYERGYFSLDDRADKTVLTRKRDLSALTQKFMNELTPPAESTIGYLQRLPLELMPPRTYVSPEHALVALRQTEIRLTVPFSLRYLENLYLQGSEQKIPEGHGTLRLQ